MLFELFITAIFSTFIATSTCFRKAYCCSKLKSHLQFSLAYDPSTTTVSEQSTKIVDYESWLSKPEIGVKISGKINHTLFEFQTGLWDRGLSAAIQFNPGEKVIVLPTESTLYASNSNNIQCPSGLEKFWDEFPSTTRLSMILLQEWFKGTNSKFFSYISFLPNPSESVSPIHWSDDFLESYPYSSLRKSVTLQKQKWRGIYDELQSCPNEAFHVPYERFVWAMEMVLSRAFQGVGGLAMGEKGQQSKLLFLISTSLLILASTVFANAQTVDQQSVAALIGACATLTLLPMTAKQHSVCCVLMPAIDSCNHIGRNSQLLSHKMMGVSEVQQYPLMGPNCELALEPVAGSFTLRAKRTIFPGEQVTISYGDRSNDYLLQYFGFLEESNYFDKYVIRKPIKTLLNILNRNDTKVLFPNDDKIHLLVTEMQQRLNSYQENYEKLEDQEIILRTRGVDTWSLGSFTDIFINKNQKMMTNVQNNTVLRASLRVLVELELFRMKRYLDDPGVEAIDKGNHKYSLAKKFLEEKVVVLETCLSNLSSL